MDKLLAGDDPALETLRRQYAVASVSEREFSGVGFFTTFTLPQSAPKLDGATNFTLDAYADLAGVENGAAFILFIRDGALDLLEGYVHDGAWPSEPVLQKFLSA